MMLRLFLEFFKIGLFAVGGGAATIPFLSVLSENTGWFTKTDLANMIAISESTPGAIGVNMASYVGFLVGNNPIESLLGCVVASLGLVTPSVIVILIISAFLQKFNENKIVKDVFYGLRPASTGLIAAAAFEIMKVSLLRVDSYNLSKSLLDLIDIRSILLFLVLFIAVNKTKFHPVLYIFCAALIGVIFGL